MRGAQFRFVDGVRRRTQPRGRIPRSTTDDRKTAYRSFYYAGAEEPEDIVLPPAETAHLCIDIKNYYLQQEDPEEGWHRSSSACTGR